MSIMPIMISAFETVDVVQRIVDAFFEQKAGPGLCQSWPDVKCACKIIQEETCLMTWFQIQENRSMST